MGCMLLKERRSNGGDLGVSERIDVSRFATPQQQTVFHVNTGTNEGTVSLNGNSDAGLSGRQTEREVLVALYPYDSRADGDLSFQKGDVMYLLDHSNCDWWYVRHQRTGQTGYVPRNFVARQQTIESEE
uniref:SH3 domain-containing protein n=1 Tax=Caenorhabditis japonica TaxID=281687 RepID=A0A8R1EBA3_CAEJA